MSDLQKLKEQLEELIASERNYEKEDDPKSNCAAYHRGAIAAYQNILERLDWQFKEKRGKRA